MSKLVVNAIESKNKITIPLSVNSDINVVAGKTYKLNNITVLSETQVLGKNMPSGEIIGHNDEQTLYSKTLNGFILTNDITINTAIDVDLPINSSAISFDSPNKTGIFEIDSTIGLEKVKINSDLEIAGYIDLVNSKEFKINGKAVLSSKQVLGITRETNLLNNDATISISALFGSQKSGSYRFFDLIDPRISGTIFLKHNGELSEPDVRVDSNSANVSTRANTINSLNIYIISNIVIFENKTGNTVSLVVYGEV